MPGSAIKAYMERLPVLKAELFNLHSDAAVLPWAKPVAQRGIVKRWQAGVDRFVPKPKPNLMQLTGLGLMVVRHPGAGKIEAEKINGDTEDASQPG
jgi:hypothetical protein